MALVLILPPSVLSIGKPGDVVEVTDEKADSLVNGGWARRLYDERIPLSEERAAAHQAEAEKFAANIRDALPATVPTMTPREEALLANPEMLAALKRGIAQAKAGNVTPFDEDDPEFGAMVLEDLAELADDADLNGNG